MGNVEYLTYRGWTIEQHKGGYIVWVDDWYKTFDDIDGAYIFIDEMLED